MRIVPLVVLLILSSVAQAQAVYKWTDEQGVVHYGDRAPSNTQTEEIAIARSPPVPGAAIDAGAPHDPLRSVSQAPVAAQPQPLDIVMYARADCGYCAKARRFFAERSIPYLELDVQRNAKAHAEWKSFGGQGVPLFVINRIVSRGFSEPSMTKQLARHGW